MKKMVSFIRQEAEEKAEEIRAKAEEEASIEKANLVQQEKIKIATQYERKVKQLAVQKKMYVLCLFFVAFFVFNSRFQIFLLLLIF